MGLWDWLGLAGSLGGVVASWWLLGRTGWGSAQWLGEREARKDRENKRV